MMTFSRLKALMRAIRAHQGGELVLVVVLGGVRPGLVGDATGGIGDAGALLGQLQRGALGVGEDLGLAPGRDQVEAHRGLPGGAASLVCMSVQKPQPLIWLARIFTSSRVAAGSVESDEHLARRDDVLQTLLRSGLPKGSSEHPWCTPSVVAAVTSPLDETARQVVTGTPPQSRRGTSPRLQADWLAVTP